MFLILIASCFLPLYSECDNSNAHYAIVSKDECSKITPDQALKIGHRAIETHFKISIDQSKLCSYDEGDYYLITVKIDKNALGGGVSAKVDAYTGKVIEVFFTE